MAGGVLWITLPIPRRRPDPAASPKPRLPVPRPVRALCSTRGNQQSGPLTPAPNSQTRLSEITLRDFAGSRRAARQCQNPSSALTEGDISAACFISRTPHPLMPWVDTSQPPSCRRATSQIPRFTPFYLDRQNRIPYRSDDEKVRGTIGSCANWARRGLRMPR